MAEYLKDKEQKLAHLKSLEKIPSINPQKYSEFSSYQYLDYISHRVFGVGLVEEVIDQKTIKAFFPSGVEILKQGQPPL